MTSSLKKMDRRWGSAHPEVGEGPLPVEPYVSAEYFEREREKVFKRTWLAVGRVDDVPKTGDHLVKYIEILKAPLLIVRGTDDQVRGFYNICRHRGNTLCRESGNARYLSCGFHGWNYELDGSLVSAPFPELYPDDFKREDYPLLPVATEIWEGFIFINVDPDPKESLHEYLEEFADRFNGYFDRFQRTATYSVDVHCNWKVVLGANTESIHTPFLHRESVGLAFAGAANPASRFNQVKLFKRHRYLSVYGNPDHKPAPIQMAAAQFGTRPLYPSQAAADALPPGVNPDRNASWAFDIDVIFPTFQLVPSNGYCFTVTYWPLAVDRTTVEMDVYMEPAQNAGDVVNQQLTRTVVRDVFREDLNTLENTQAALSAGLLKELPISDEEIALLHNHRVVEKYLRS